MSETLRPLVASLEAAGFVATLQEHQVRVSLPLYSAVVVSSGPAGPHVSVRFGFVTRGVAIALDMAAVLLGATVLWAARSAIPGWFLFGAGILLVGAVAWDISRFRITSQALEQIRSIAQRAA